eukprot:Rhum_TRINITY_DN14805_c20_g1::Rhum_TRINITY_DN14805_c20_g1_i1::g.121510::m.121510
MSQRGGRGVGAEGEEEKCEKPCVLSQDRGNCFYPFCMGGGGGHWLLKSNVKKRRTRNKRENIAISRSQLQNIPSAGGNSIMRVEVLVLVVGRRRRGALKQGVKQVLVHVDRAHLSAVAVGVRQPRRRRSARRQHRRRLNLLRGRRLPACREAKGVVLLGEVRGRFSPLGSRVLPRQRHRHRCGRRVKRPAEGRVSSRCVLRGDALCQVVHSVLQMPQDFVDLPVFFVGRCAHAVRIHVRVAELRLSRGHLVAVSVHVLPRRRERRPPERRRCRTVSIVLLDGRRRSPPRRMRQRREPPVAAVAGHPLRLIRRLRLRLRLRLLLLLLLLRRHRLRRLAEVHVVGGVREAHAVLPQLGFDGTDSARRQLPQQARQVLAVVLEEGTQVIPEEAVRHIRDRVDHLVLVREVVGELAAQAVVDAGGALLEAVDGPVALLQLPLQVLQLLLAQAHLARLQRLLLLLQLHKLLPLLLLLRFLLPPPLVRLLLSRGRSGRSGGGRRRLVVAAAALLLVALGGLAEGRLGEALALVADDVVEVDVVRHVARVAQRDDAAQEGEALLVGDAAAALVLVGENALLLVVGEAGGEAHGLPVEVLAQRAHVGRELQGVAVPRPVLDCELVTVHAQRHLVPLAEVGDVAEHVRVAAGHRPALPLLVRQVPVLQVERQLRRRPHPVAVVELRHPARALGHELDRVTEHLDDQRRAAGTTLRPARRHEAEVDHVVVAGAPLLVARRLRLPPVARLQLLLLVRQPLLQLLQLPVLLLQLHVQAAVRSRSGGVRHRLAALVRREHGGPRQHGDGRHRDVVLRHPAGHGYLDGPGGSGRVARRRLDGGAEGVLAPHRVVVDGVEDEAVGDAGGLRRQAVVGADDLDDAVAHVQADAERRRAVVQAEAELLQAASPRALLEALGGWGAGNRRADGVARLLAAPSVEPGLLEVAVRLRAGLLLVQLAQARRLCERGRRRDGVAVVEPVHVLQDA